MAPDRGGRAGHARAAGPLPTAQPVNWAAIKDRDQREYQRGGIGRPLRHRIATGGQKRAAPPTRGPRPGGAPPGATVIMAVAGLVVVALIVTIAATRSAGGTGSPAGTRAVSVTAGPGGPVHLGCVP